MAENKTTRRPILPEEFTSHAQGAFREARHAFQTLVPKPPEEFVQHRRAARREALLAVRSLIDAAIARTEKA
jgi:hypothetical protein